MANVAQGGGGGGLYIHVNPDEITTIYQYLEDILVELETNAHPNIEKLGEINYYTAGKAMPTMEVYPEANEKIKDLYDNYSRAASLVVEILHSMMEADEAIAQQIIDKLGV